MAPGKCSDVNKFRRKSAPFQTVFAWNKGLKSLAVFLSKQLFDLADDTIEDRAMYMVLEALAEEPLFIPGLLYLAECHLGSNEGAFAGALLNRVEQIQPGNKHAAALRSRLREPSEPSATGPADVPPSAVPIPM